MNDHRRKPLVSILWRLLSAALLGHVLLVYLPFSITALLVIAALGLGVALLSPGRSLPLVASLTLVTLLLEAVVRFGGFGITPYFRAHEMLARDTTYKPNSKVEMTVPHGDLLTIDPSLPRDLATPRFEVFTTDEYGYRNDDDYKGERLILVGDSFIVGTTRTLASHLKDDHGLAAYNAGFSSIGPLIYADKVRWARQHLAPDACIVVFFFEGNDFQLVDPSELAVRNTVPRGLQQFIKGYVEAIRGNSEWSKVFYGLTARAALNLRRNATLDKDSVEPRTLVRSVGSQQMAFLHGYSMVVRRTSFDDHDFIRSRLEYAPPDAVFFVPDKFRVYAPHFAEQPEPDLPHAQWSYLKSAADALGIQAIDLTTHIVERSRQLLEQDITTYWPDDTHWNDFGQRLAAEILIQELRESSKPTCSEAVQGSSQN